MFDELKPVDTMIKTSCYARGSIRVILHSISGNGYLRCQASITKKKIDNANGMENGIL